MVGDGGSKANQTLVAPPNYAMMLLEHDAKELLGTMRLSIPRGRLVRSANDTAGVLPLVVKAQVPVGGRGRAGGIRIARSQTELGEILHALIGMKIKGHEARAVRLEELVEAAFEAYVSFSIDARIGKVRILISPQGGIDIEEEAVRPQIRHGVADLDASNMHEVVLELTKALPCVQRVAIQSACDGLIEAFFRYEAVLIEINPLFIRDDGSCVIGDAKMIIDDNAFERQPLLVERIASQHELYPQASLKLNQGYDFVCLDETGDVGLVTTGAGLSIQLIDELIARGCKPFNFCDIRTGMFRGDPARLIQVLRWIANGANVRAVLVNFFAGMTDLAEIATLLLAALDQVPELRAPVVARLIGNNLDQALQIISAASNPLVVETDLERAMDRTLEALAIP